MTDLISTPPTPASPQGSKVTTPAWWPDIDINAVRATVNLGGSTIAHERLVEAIRFAAIEVIGELTEWQIDQNASGFDTLAAVEPQPSIDGEGQFVTLFQRAVTMTAAAELADRNPDLTATRVGFDQQKDRLNMADDFRRSATRAIRAIVGETGTLVDLV
jgi:Fe-S-cluster formation regulator IscX/YfhJ